MKIEFIITNNTVELLSNTDTGDNTLIINGVEIPTSSWVGSGYYVYDGISIKKISSLDGNIYCNTVSDTEYELAAKSGASYIPSHVGMVIQSTTLSTLAQVQVIYGSNTTWIQHTGYILRGADSSVTANSASSDGGADSVTPSGTNSGGVVKGTTLTSAQSGVPAHSHGLNNHTHGVGTLGGSATKGGSWSFKNQALARTNSATTNVASVSNVTRSASSDSFRRIANNSYTQTVTPTGDVITHDGHTHTLSITGSTGGSTASTANNTAANASAAHDHGFTNPTFTGDPHTNIPKYKNVYIWERTA